MTFGWTLKTVKPLTSTEAHKGWGEFVWMAMREQPHVIQTKEVWTQVFCEFIFFLCHWTGNRDLICLKTNKSIAHTLKGGSSCTKNKLKLIYRLVLRLLLRAAAGRKLNWTPNQTAGPREKDYISNSDTQADWNKQLLFKSIYFPEEAHYVTYSDVDTYDLNIV